MQIGTEGQQFTDSGSFIHTWSSMYVTLTSTEIQLSIMCKFVSTIHEENWIYIFTCLIQAFSGRMWWIQESDCTVRYCLRTKKVGQAQIFHQRPEILSVTCILFGGRIYGVMIVYGLRECISSISWNTNLF